MLINFPIGDWSGDGHEQVSAHTFQSNLELDEVREAHHSMREKLGFSIEDFLNEYGENVLSEEWRDKLDKLGLSIAKDIKPKDLAILWSQMLMLANEDLILDFVEQPETITFYGFDEKGRHVAGAGYGLFGLW